MNNTQVANHNLATMAWGVLLIWWGVVIVVGPLTIGMGAIGTGLILLGVNVARRFSRVQIKNSNTPVALIAIVWGTLDQVLALHFWPSFATLLIVTGVVSIVFLLLSSLAQGESQA